ncbi:MAG TPA: tetratricopeptide repeat protein, partial [Candidatus Acidoferrum sp.]|nr:tetratricopeptide repeat protein [Candidatus Acidoferrum sp.]
VPPVRLNQILLDLQLSPDSFSDSANLGRLAQMSKADTIVSGRYTRVAGQVHVEATLRDMKSDRTISFAADAANGDIPPVVDSLAKKIRENLSLQGDVVAELGERSFKPSTQSVEALRLYTAAKELQRQGKNLQALTQFQAATQADPKFALAYAGVGETYENLGHDAEAEQASRKAVELADTLPQREKYLIAASDASIQHDYPKAIEYYENLTKSAPDDPEFQYKLGVLYEDTGTFDKAREHYSKALAADPNDVSAVLSTGRVEIKSDDPAGALKDFNRALSLSNQLGNDETKAMTLQGIGLAYRELGKQDQALRYFQQALETRRRLDDKRGIAVTLNVIAQIEDQNGKSAEALQAYQEALQIRRDIGDKSGLGDTLLDLGTFYNYRGHYDEALNYFKQSLQVERELGDENSQGLALNNIGYSYLSKGDFENAVTYFQQALEMRQKSQVPADIALTLHNLALASEKMGQYDTALADYERALDLDRKIGDKRGAAIELYAMGTIFGDQGRLGAAVNVRQEALKNFTDLGDRTFWMAEALSGYGKSLADAGRFDDAQKPLTDGLALARDLKIDGSISQALDFQGKCLFYRGDFKAARALYDQALQFASRSKEQEKILLTQFDIAEVLLKQGQTSTAGAMLRKIAAQADNLGMKSLSFESSVLWAEAIMQSKDYASARQKLENAVAAAEKLELRTVLARAHYLLADNFRLSGQSTDAADHYRQALQYLEQIRNDTGSGAFLTRSDIKVMYAQCRNWTQRKS